MGCFQNFLGNIEISKHDFEQYESVRESGITNMFDVNTVMQLSDLTRAQIITIMQNYDRLTKMYPDVRRE